MAQNRYVIVEVKYVSGNGQCKSMGVMKLMCQGGFMFPETSPPLLGDNHQC